MTEAVDQIKSQLGRLSMKERAELAHFFITSLDENCEEESDVAAAWEAEVARRTEEMRSGKTVGIPLEEVLAKLRKQVP